MRLLSHISITRQFALIGVLAGLSVALPSTLYLRSALKELRFAETEAAATPAVRALYDGIRLTQEHRGLATAALSGNTKAAAQRPAKEAEVSLALSAASERVRQTFGASDMPAAWATITHDWEALREDVKGGQLSAPDAFKRHTALVSAELALLDRVVDASGWALDPDTNTRFTIIGTTMDGIQLTERVGQLRAFGTRLLTQREVKAEDRLAVHTLVALAQDSHQRVRAAFAKAMAADPAYRSSFAAALDQLSAQLEPALKLAVDEVVEADTPSHDPNDFFAAMTAPIQQQFGINRLGADQLDRTLTARADEVRATVALLGFSCLLTAAAAAVLGIAMARSTIKGLKQARSTAQAVAAGDLTQPVASGGRNELGQLLDALGTMQQHLAGIVSHVRQTADGVATASQQIAQGNLDLSSRTEAQASAIQQTAASMEQLLEAVQHNAGHAQQADAVAQSARGLAETGGGAVGAVVGTMDKISHSSNKIADIIGVIDGIAFQTNILALNASVEAARAGEQGRGFAVVASEVRNLAQRATAAAREIKGLIAASSERVEEGAVQAQQAGGTMQEVVGSIQRVADLMRSISAATEQQTAGLSQVNAAMSDMDETTQQNAALVEQSAAAASSLQQQARELVDTVAVFRLPEPSFA